MLSCFRHVPLSVTLWTVAHQALSIGLLRQVYWSGLPFPSPGDLPHPGIKPGFPASQADPLPPSHQGNPQCFLVLINLASGRLPPSSNFPSYTLSFWYTQVSDFFFHIFYLFFSFRFYTEVRSNSIYFSVLFHLHNTFKIHSYYVKW